MPAVDREGDAPDVVSPDVTPGLDASPDVTPRFDAGTDGGGDAAVDVAADAADVRAPCVLRGEGVFARILRGETELTRSAGGASAHFSLETGAYFPRGRVAGASVILTLPTRWPFAGWFELRGTIDTAGGASGLTFNGSTGMDLALSGRLLAPEGGAAFDVEANVASPGTDVRDSAAGAIELCPTGDAPAPAIALPDAQLAPTEALRIMANVPLVADGLTVTVVAGDAPVPVLTTVEAGVIVMRPVGAYPPNRPITVRDLTARDLLGRTALAPTTTLMPRSTTATVTDLTMTTDPPAGSVVSTTSMMVSGGALTLLTAPGSFSALLSLGAPPGGARTLAVRLMGIACSDGATVSLIDAAGHRADATFACEGSAPEGTVMIPGSGPLWLSITRMTPGNRPQWLPGPAVPFVINELVWR